MALLSGTAIAAWVRCGDEFITFEATVEEKTGSVNIVTVQKRMILIIMVTSNGEIVVVIGRDGVPAIVRHYITPDTYREFMQCLYY